MRKNKLAKNTISSLIFQIVTIISGFILPRLILSRFGSEINGLVNSITQFLQIIALLELGVGAVVQSSLYKPLSNNNFDTVSKMIVSAEKFFKKIAYILLIYVIILVFTYALIAKTSYSWLFTAMLIISISISFFSQYYFGVVDRLLLVADQRGYIQYNTQTITLVLNTVVSFIFIQIGCSIQLVKLTTSIIYLIRPIYLRWYVNRNYQIDRGIIFVEEPIKQKWNGLAQHIAAVVLDQTDNIVLTIFDSLRSVSIYSTYFLVINGVKQLFMSLTNGVQSLIGELWAKQEEEKLRTFFSFVEWMIHTGVTLIFGCTAILIVPFIKVYVHGINDANYIQPLFALLIVIANAMHCLRLPYNIMILAGGHYKETQYNYIIAALLNICFSIIAVKIWGLIGVALGTILAMAYQTIWMAWYNSKNFILWPFVNFFKCILVDSVVIVLSFMICGLFELKRETYFSWMVLASKVFGVVFSIEYLVNKIVFPDKIEKLFCRIVKKKN